MKTMQRFFLWLIIAAVVLLLMEVIEYEPAVVRKVTEGSRFYDGDDVVTLVKFDDGVTDKVPGDRGAPGERILARRQRGAETMFGIIGRRIQL